ncbi:2-iminobutanoate/2-iminopropanoate deaminase [Polaromonas sp. OV174]|uniref:RidA family protein n=1 Tax=Polaromonas sp. OV174 TaxID=1855300 RepID=UPI0008E6FE1E|nr:RidA family protein [Polaromonas sp. OV174]SFC05620.1 2-iminobutanoate/2-iminopropanoate deaminase [Polaromonas sp. OV174]
MKKLLHSAAIPAPKFRYTPCVQSGPHFSISGMVGLDPATGQLVAGGPAAETQRIFDNLKLALPDYGLSLQNMTLARIYTTDFAAFGQINAAWDAMFADIAPPARTSLGVQALPLGATVEIEFAFYQPQPALAADTE